ncbi:amidohydrolase family protein [Microbacterium sp. SSW1-59]|uniref:amidohydrolase family protein n=1 Tax=Microbacterium xanthum TaxID=3079794 RepID=UPI002AD22CA3|nr:amidohydrolase family protein [Microbacterium sp. SSW1-59]MDZ8200339.1 amidohydrolase family protein [Microbacterium sp. SSW1-59]
MTIDAHAHVWDTTELRYPWLDDAPHLPRTFLPRDLQRDGAVPYVFVEADCASGHAEARWVAGLGADGPAAIVAFARIESARVAAELDALAGVPGVTGIRRLWQDQPADMLRSPATARGLRLLPERGLVFDVCVRWEQLEVVADVVRAHPDVHFVIDHLGKPPVARPELLASWRRSLAACARENVSVKLSGLPAEDGAAVDGECRVDLAPWLRAAFELFGADRAMVGSDWPVSADRGFGRPAWFAAVRAALGLGADEWHRVSHANAARVYRVGASSAD